MNSGESDCKAVARIEFGLIAGGLLGISFLLPHALLWGDGGWRFVYMSDLLTTGHLSDKKYSLIGPLFSAPLWLLGRMYQSPEWWCEKYNAAVFAVGLFIFYRMLRDRVPRPLLRRFLLLLTFASMFANHLLFYWGEVFTAIMVGIGTVCLLTRRRGWTAIVLGVANTPATVPALMLLTARRVWDTRRLRPVLAVAAAVAVVLLEAWIRRGSPFESGYGDDRGPKTIMPFSGRPWLSYPIFFGLLSLLLSFGKGLLFFAPGLFLPVHRRLAALPGRASADLTTLYGMWTAFTVGLILLYSTYWSWSGSTFYGPRYLLFASLPACLVLAVRLHRQETSILANTITVLALGLSLWVGLCGAVFGDAPARAVCLDPTGPQFEAPLCYYTPEFSALWVPFIHAQQLTAGQYLFLLYGLTVAVYLMAPPLLELATQVLTRARLLTRSFRDDRARARLRRPPVMEGRCQLVTSSGVAVARTGSPGSDRTS
ncbi:hypothetical protein [Sphaerisporangium fuscum]|uniref:hypothetical protein n=1 Tax=Sphaerisporangium fuscum TaxID=2835868 RepID=UPI001BDD3C32|nr:hypothetical protein [Sphaerisporangium fuscum]